MLIYVCHDCHAPIHRNKGARGPIPKRCPGCAIEHDRFRQRGHGLITQCVCAVCAVVFERRKLTGLPPKYCATCRPEVLRKQQAQRYQRNPEPRRTADKRWRNANPEWYLEIRRRQYRRMANDPERWAKYLAGRRAAKARRRERAAAAAAGTPAAN